jgi:hypothetical protein
MNKKRKNRGNWLYFFTTLAYVLMFVWVFMFPGTKGLVFWDPGYAMYFYILGFVGVIPIILWLLDRFVVKKRLYSVISKLLSFILLLVPIAVVTFFLVSVSFKTVNLPPLVFINDNTQEDRYTLAYWTDEKRADSLEITVSKVDDVQTIQLKDDVETNKHYFTFGQHGPATYEITSQEGSYTMVIPENDANIKRFAIASDSHIGTTKSALETSKKMLETISSVPYNSFFLLGDIVEFGFSFEQWVEAWGILASKETTVPFRPLIGNHDILFGGNKLFDELMGKDYFRIDFDNVHFISLNLPWGIEDFSNKQKQWLETELKSIPADDWTIVLTHAFLYASGYNYRGVLWGDNKNAIDELVPLFEETGVDMVFSGHNHQMEHITNNGIEYFITGVFGSHLDEDREFTSEGSQWYNNKTHGYVDLAVGETSATATFLDTNGEGLYSYALEK